MSEAKNTGYKTFSAVVTIAGISKRVTLQEGPHGVYGMSESVAGFQFATAADIDFSTAE